MTREEVHQWAKWLKQYAESNKIRASELDPEIPNQERMRRAVLETASRQEKVAELLLDLQQEIDDLRTKVQTYQEQVVHGMYELETPRFAQGSEGESEITSPITAPEVQRYVDELFELRERLRKEEGDGR